jgi:transposase
LTYKSYKIKKIIAYFVEDLPATKAARILEINCNTINSYYNENISLLLEKMIKCGGDFELNESYFGAKRV